jgi:hypothetical protein
MHSLYLLLFFPSPLPCSQTSTFSSRITSPHILSYSPHTSHYLVRGPLVENVAQILAPSLSFYLTSFPFPLILFTLPLSLIEQHYFRLLNIHFQLILPHILSKEGPHHFFHFSLFAAITKSTLTPFDQSLLKMLLWSYKNDILYFVSEFDAGKS